jgi:membrane-associated phospholipid phosphatase
MKPTRLLPLLCALSLLAPVARAELSTTLGVKEPPPAPPRSMWRPEWPTFSKVEGVATVAAGAGTAMLFVLKPPKEARWEGPILFDEGARDVFRLKSATDRQKARSWGEVPYYAAPLLPLVIDPIFVAWLANDDGKAAVNMAAVGLEAFSYAGFLSFVSTRLSVRERPNSLECRRPVRPAPDCEVDTEAFYSGHTTIAAVSAGVVCANHRAMPLWGHPVADAGACALATTSAVAGGVSRLASDRHYATDVVAGFGMGFGVGYAVPTLLHYARPQGDVTVSLAPGSPCTGACLRVAGSF